MKQVSPLELAGHPSSGVLDDESAAAIAASLGWAKQKPLQIQPVPRPVSRSASDASAAALKAARVLDTSRQSPSLGPSSGPTSPPLPRSPNNAVWINAAASQAYLSLSPNPMPFPRSPLRPRSASTSVVGDPHVRSPTFVSASALCAASAAHRPYSSFSPPLSDGGLGPLVTMPRNMFTSNTPVQQDRKEEIEASSRRATAIASARTMYAQQQKMIDAVTRVNVSVTSSALTEHDAEPGPGAPINLQEAAYRMAQERLKKLHTELEKNKEYHEYFGGDLSVSPPHQRVSFMNKLRRRSASTGESKADGTARHRSMLQGIPVAIDDAKRQHDRNAVLETARKNVKSLLQDMDAKLKASGATTSSFLPSDWDGKAQAAAQANHELRSENRDQVDVGGGLYMSRVDIEAIARKRLRPLLANIEEKVHTELEKQATLKAEQEAKNFHQENQRTRERVERQNSRKTKERERQEEKARRNAGRTSRSLGHRRERSSSAPGDPSVLLDDSVLGASSATRVKNWLKWRPSTFNPTNEPLPDPSRTARAISAEPILSAGAVAPLYLGGASPAARSTASVPSEDRGAVQITAAIAVPLTPLNAAAV